MYVRFFHTAASRGTIRGGWFFHQAKTARDGQRANTRTSSGTFTNGERRVQRVNEVIPPLAGTKTDGQIVVAIINRMGVPQRDHTPDGVLAEIACQV